MEVQVVNFDFVKLEEQLLVIIVKEHYFVELVVVLDFVELDFELVIKVKQNQKCSHLV